jgi:hypothetical protein
VYIADDVVDVLMIDHHFGVSAFYEHLLELLYVAGVFYSVNLSSRHHTVADARLGEIQSVLENLDFLLNLFVAFGIVDTRLHQVVKVYAGELMIVLLLLHLDASQPQQTS